MADEKRIDPKLDTVTCVRCRRTIRRTMSVGVLVEGVVSEKKRRCGGTMASSCIDTAPTRRAKRMAREAIDRGKDGQT